MYNGINQNSYSKMHTRKKQKIQTGNEQLHFLKINDNYQPKTFSESSYHEFSETMNLGEMDERIKRLEKIIEEQFNEIQELKRQYDESQQSQKNEILELQEIINNQQCELDHNNKSECQNCKLLQKNEIQLKQQILKQSHQILKNIKENDTDYQKRNQLEIQINDYKEQLLFEIQKKEQVISLNKELEIDSQKLKQEIEQLKQNLNLQDQNLNQIISQFEIKERDYKKKISDQTQQQLGLWKENLEYKTKKQVKTFTIGTQYGYLDTEQKKDQMNQTTDLLIEDSQMEKKKEKYRTQSLSFKNNENENVIDNQQFCQNCFIKTYMQSSPQDRQSIVRKISDLAKYSESLLKQTKCIY